MKTQLVKTVGQKRTETGPVKIDDDWTGVFIRGDECAGILGDVELYGLELTFKHRLKELLESANELPKHD